MDALQANVQALCTSVDDLADVLCSAAPEPPGSAAGSTEREKDESSAVAIAQHMEQIVRQQEALHALQPSGLYLDLLTQQEVLLRALLPKLQACAEQLQGLLDKDSLPDVPDFCKLQPSPEQARNIITYAHKLCYTTFAPPGYQAGVTQLRHFRPPMPQEWQMRASQLHASQPGVAEARVGGTVGASSPAAPVEAMDMQVERALPQLPPMPEGWKPGDPLPELPPMPPGWKPGDPIPDLTAGAAIGAAAQMQPISEEPGEPPQKQPPAKEPASNAAFDFILNPDWEAVEEDFSEEDSE